MGRPGKSKVEIIDSLAKAFRRYGFDGATLSLLTKETGLERASLYHHFPKGKTDMAEAVLLDALTKLNLEVVERLKGERPVKDRLKAMLRATENFYDGGNELCFVTIFSLSPISEDVSGQMGDIVSEWSKLLTKSLRESGVATPKQAAEQAIATIQGGLIVSYNMKDKALFKRCLSQLRANWDL